MTGYGRGTSGNFKVEVRSSNHKNLDIHINIPYYLYSHEPEMKKTVKKTVHRGRIEIFIPKQEMDSVKLKVNIPLAREYYNAFLALKDELSLADDVQMEMLTSQKDLFILDEPEIDMAGLYGALENALEELKKTRTEEGASLIRDITERIALIEEYVVAIERKRDEFILSARERLAERLRDFLGDIQVDDERLIQETAILVERSDITEEIVRIKSHMHHLTRVLETGGAIGKKLDFIVQELRREINTIGSKAQHYEIASNVVDVKHELEKIREQIQNLQ